MVSKRPFLIAIYCFTLMLPTVGASTVKIDNYFESQLNQLNQKLVTNKALLKQDHLELKTFVNANVLPLWSSETTLKALLGSKSWKTLTSSRQKELIDAFNMTLHRYVREGMKYYDNQKFSFVSTMIGKKGRRGFLKIKIEPELLPAIDVTFKMTKIKENWKLYDILLAGVSYVKMKKLEVRRLHKEKGIQSVLDLLNSKNSISPIEPKTKNAI